MGGISVPTSIYVYTERVRQTGEELEGERVRERETETETEISELYGSFTMKCLLIISK